MEKTGWICPKCGCGASPNVDRCPCVGQTLPVSYPPYIPWYPPMQPYYTGYVTTNDFVIGGCEGKTTSCNHTCGTNNGIDSVGSTTNSTGTSAEFAQNMIFT